MPGTPQGQRAAQYLEDGANRSIVEGLSQAYKVNKLLGSGAGPAASKQQHAGRAPAGTWLTHTAAAHAAAALAPAGAEGNTWLVQDVQTNKPLAIKLIQLPLPTRFVQAIFR